MNSLEGNKYHHRVGTCSDLEIAIASAFQKWSPTKISLRVFFENFAFKKDIKVFSHQKKFTSIKILPLFDSMVFTKSLARPTRAHQCSHLSCSTVDCHILAQVHCQVSMCGASFQLNPHPKPVPLRVK